MPRIREIDPADLDPELRARLGDTPVTRVLGHRPEWLARYLDEHRPTLTEGTIDRETKELVRFMISSHTGCRT